MAQTRRSRTVKLPNGDRVTIATGTTRNGYYKTVTLKRRDGTGESVTNRRNAGLFGSGLFDIRGAYRDDIPSWARGTMPPSRRSPGILGLLFGAFGTRRSRRRPLTDEEQALIRPTEIEAARSIYGDKPHLIKRAVREDRK